MSGHQTIEFSMADVRTCMDAGRDLADAVRAATREAWPSGGPHRGRLFAFGFDAFRLAQALRQRAPQATSASRA